MDGTLLLGLLAAIVASVCYNGGLALQSLDAREVSTDHSLKFSLIGRLLKRPRWVFGTALTIVGWPLQALALIWAPLTLVQPALAAGLILLLFIGHAKLNEKVGMREIAGVAGIVLGVAGLALVAPDNESSVTDALGIAVGLGALGSITALLFLVNRRASRPGISVAIGAGFGYAFGGITTKLMSDAITQDELFLMLVWAGATGCGSGMGFLLEMTALQTIQATKVAPLVFTVQLLAPVLLAPVMVGESWSQTPLGGAVLLFFVAVVAVGAFFVASSPAVGSLVSSAESSSETGTP